MAIRDHIPHCVTETAEEASVLRARGGRPREAEMSGRGQPQVGAPAPSTFFKARMDPCLWDF